MMNVMNELVIVIGNRLKEGLCGNVYPSEASEELRDMDFGDSSGSMSR